MLDVIRKLQSCLNCASSKNELRGMRLHMLLLIFESADVVSLLRYFSQTSQLCCVFHLHVEARNLAEEFRQFGNFRGINLEMPLQTSRDSNVGNDHSVGRGSQRS